MPHLPPTASSILLGYHCNHNLNKTRISLDFRVQVKIAFRSASKLTQQLFQVTDFQSTQSLKLVQAIHLLLVMKLLLAVYSTSGKPATSKMATGSSNGGMFSTSPSVHQPSMAVASACESLGGDPLYIEDAAVTMISPHKYNSKLMNSIWGLYNQYAPPAFQKNLEY